MRHSVDPNAAGTSYRKHISSQSPRAGPAPKPPAGPHYVDRARSRDDRRAAAPADTNDETRCRSSVARSPPCRHRVPLVRDGSAHSCPSGAHAGLTIRPG